MMASNDSVENVCMFGSYFNSETFLQLLSAMRAQRKEVVFNWPNIQIVVSARSYHTLLLFSSDDIYSKSKLYKRSESGEQICLVDNTAFIFEAILTVQGSDNLI